MGREETCAAVSLLLEAERRGGVWPRMERAATVQWNPDENEFEIIACGAGSIEAVVRVNEDGSLEVA